RPAGLGSGIALRGASNQRHNRGLRIGVTSDLSSILRDGRSTLHVRQEPIPVCVSDPRRPFGKPIHVDFAAVEETGRTRSSAMGIGPGRVAFDPEYPFPDLIVISDFAAAEDTGKARVCRVAVINEGPTRETPIGPQICTDVETGPVVRCLYCGSLVNRCLGDQGSPGRGVGDKLVAKAAIQAPALDVVSPSI